MKLLSEKDLRARGIKFTRQHRHRMIQAGKFPRPIKIGANTNAWLEFEVDDWLKDRIAKRDAEAA